MPQQLSSAPPSYRCIGIFGEAGTGKSTFATRLKLPGQKTYILDADGNLAGPKLVAEKEKRDISHIDFDPIRFEDDGKTQVPPLQQYRRLASKLQWAKQQKKPDGSQVYGLIYVTSATVLSEIFANEVRLQLGKSIDYAFQIQDWGKYAFLWNYFIMEVLRGMPCTTIIDGHRRIEKGQMDQVLKEIIAIPGSTAELLPARLTDVFQATADQKMENGQMVAVYNMVTLQSTRVPGMKTSLDLPTQFPSTQEWADKIVQQLVSTQPKQPTT